MVCDLWDGMVAWMPSFAKDEDCTDKHIADEPGRGSWPLSSISMIRRDSSSLRTMAMDWDQGLCDRAWAYCMARLEAALLALERIIMPTSCRP